MLRLEVDGRKDMPKYRRVDCLPRRDRLLQEQGLSGRVDRIGREDRSLGA